jgi:transmembrane sensor
MSNQHESAEVEDQACAWAVKIDAGELDPGTLARLEFWLAANLRHRGALLRAQAALSYLDRGRALRDSVSEPVRAPRFTRRHLLWAAGALAATAAGLGTLELIGFAGRRFATDLGELRRVPLPDGSVASINTQSVLEVAIKPNLRQIHLARGEAWFQVAKDARRPFLVEAGRFRVQAVGTAFSVRLRELGADVLVTEGIVQTWTVGSEEHRSELRAGSQAFLSDAGPVKVADIGTSTLRRTLAWREGQIALEGESLSQAAEEFNRYNTRKIVITDPALAKEQLVGEFRTSEPAAFARAVSMTLGATVREAADTIELSRAAAPQE